jgi:RNA polymerase sigma factor (sigma-70 family)
MAGQSGTQASDQDIILLLWDGDEEGLRALLRVYGPPVRGFLTERYGHVLQKSDLDEALNVAVFNVWRFADRYDDKKASLGAWFLAIARNAAVSIIQSRLRHRHQNLEYDPGFDPAEYRTFGDDEEDESGSKQPKRMLKDLKEIVAKLPPLQRAIIEADLVCDSGRADSQWLADKHGNTRGSIEVSRNKARKTIASELVRRGYFQDKQKGS